MTDCAIMLQINRDLACLAVMHAMLDHPIGLRTVTLCLTVLRLLSVVCQAAVISGHHYLLSSVCLLRCLYQ